MPGCVRIRPGSALGWEMVAARSALGRTARNRTAPGWGRLSLEFGPVPDKRAPSLGIRFLSTFPSARVPAGLGRVKDFAPGGVYEYEVRSRGYGSGPLDRAARVSYLGDAGPGKRPREKEGRMKTKKVKVVREIRFPQGRIISADPERKGDRVEILVKPYGGRHEEENTVVISLPWSLFEGKVEAPWMIQSIPPGVYTVEWRDPQVPGGPEVLWFEVAEEEEGEDIPLLVEAPGPLSEATDAHSPGVEQVLCVCYEGDTLRAWTLIAAKPGDIFTCEEYGLPRGWGDYETTYIGCQLCEDGFVDDFGRMDYPPESLEEWKKMSR